MLAFNIYLLCTFLPFSLHPHDMCLLEKKNSCREVISVVSFCVCLSVFCSCGGKKHCHLDIFLLNIIRARIGHHYMEHRLGHRCLIYTVLKAARSPFYRRVHSLEISKFMNPQRN